MTDPRRIIVGIGGASGAIYGVRLLEALREIGGFETHLVMSSAAQITVRVETDYSLDDVRALADVCHKAGDVAAPIASGSFRVEGMIIAACSMKNLSGIVNSYTDDLLTRAADVMLKDRRKLILMPRETPLHAGHCELLLKATQLGAIVAPPMPAMYARPQSIDEMVNHTCGRVLDLFGIENDLAARWNGAGKGD